MILKCRSRYLSQKVYFRRLTESEENKIKRKQTVEAGFSMADLAKIVFKLLKIV